MDTTTNYGHITNNNRYNTNYAKPRADYNRRDNIEKSAPKDDSQNAANKGDNATVMIKRNLSNAHAFPSNP